jgi:hypothetical protein
MKRREFIRLACGTSVLAAATSRAAWAVEPQKMYRLVILHPSRPVSELTENSRFNYFREFFRELRQLGYIEGNNLVVERFSGEGRVDHYPELAREAAARNPNVIFALTHWMVRLLREASGRGQAARRGGLPSQPPEHEAMEHQRQRDGEGRDHHQRISVRRVRVEMSARFSRRG